MPLADWKPQSIFGGGNFANGTVKAAFAAVVMIETLAVTAVLPLSETGSGETVQVVSVGLPAQVNATLWLKPADGVRVRT